MHADRHFNAHVCAASSIRAMPEDEKPPASRVDIYSGTSADNGFSKINIYPIATRLFLRTEYASESKIRTFDFYDLLR